MANEGYQGAIKSLRVLHPKKSYGNSPLSSTGLSINRQIFSDQLIVENYFGRLCSI